jgi:hypothetical protein
MLYLLTYNFDFGSKAREVLTNGYNVIDKLENKEHTRRTTGSLIENQNVGTGTCKISVSISNLLQRKHTSENCAAMESKHRIPQITNT